MRIILFLLVISFSMSAQFTEEFKASIQERVDNGYAPSIAVGVLDSNGVHFYNYGKTKNVNEKQYMKSVLSQKYSLRYS
jgi:hypothetical protein